MFSSLRSLSFMTITFSSLLVPATLPAAETPAPQAPAGLRCEYLADPTGVDVLRPQMVRDLRYASGSVRTVRGDVTSAWSRTDRSVRLDAPVPLGAEAETVIPKFNLKNITVKEGRRFICTDGAFVPGVEGVIEAKDASGSIVIKTGSRGNEMGTQYQFPN